MLIYTGIGSRETPPEILKRMKYYSVNFALHGWTLRSGGADGADSAFENGCKYAAGNMEIYLPWRGFNGKSGVMYSSIIPSDAYKIAEKYHPAWGKCSDGAKKLHTRNVMQILGADLKTPSDLVICWTKDGLRGGGTGQALRIAEAYNIRIIDLAIYKEGLQLCDHCHKPGTDEEPLFETVNPYNHEMHENNDLVWMHHDCYYDSLGNI